MNYTVKRSKRKTVCIQISRSGEVIVRAPMRCPKAYIEDFVERKQPWILRHLEKISEQVQQRSRFTFSEIDSLSLCGRQVPLTVDPYKPLIVAWEGISLPSADPEQVTEELLRKLGELAEPWLKGRLDHWAELMGVSYRELKLSSAKSRWGSCTHDGVIRISCRALLAPEEAIDYLLVHELAHRRVRGHGADFYGEVACVIPEWKRGSDALRNFHGELLRMGFIK